MFKRSKVGPPERLVWLDIYRMFVGVASLIFGATILYRTLSVSLAPLAIVVGLAMIAFGGYRIWLGWHRYRLYLQRRGQDADP